MICYTNKHRIPFQVDDSDAEAVSYFSWYIHGGYVATTFSGIFYGKSNRRYPVFLHQVLLGYAPAGFEWDHENRDKMDNRRQNLRVVTHAKNMRNATVRKDSTAISPGVSRHRHGVNRWQARIKYMGSDLWLGVFDTPEDAAYARKRAEEILWADQP